MHDNKAILEKNAERLEKRVVQHHTLSRIVEKILNRAIRGLEVHVIENAAIDVSVQNKRRLAVHNDTDR